MRLLSLSIILLTIMSASNASLIGNLEEGRQDRAQRDVDMSGEKLFEDELTWLGEGQLKQASGFALTVTVHVIVCHKITDWGVNEDDELRLNIDGSKAWPMDKEYQEIDPGDVYWLSSHEVKRVESKVSDRKRYCFVDMDGMGNGSEESIGCIVWDSADVGNPDCNKNPEWSTKRSLNFKGGGASYWVRFWFSCN